MNTTFIEKLWKWLSHDPNDPYDFLEPGWQEVAWSKWYYIHRTKMAHVWSNNKETKLYRKPWYGTWGRERR